MPRPYFQARVTDLEALFERHRDDAAQLTIILEELEQREMPKAVRLKARVANRIAELTQEAPKRDVRNSQRAQIPTQTEMNFAPATGSSAPADATDSSEDKDTAAPRAARRQTATIRKPGRLTDVPAPRPPLTNNRLTLDLPGAMPLAQRYVRVLAALVEDMRRKSGGMRSLTVTDGRRISVDTGGFGYEFAFDGDEALFEGASVRVEAGGIVCEGQIASVSQNRITISLSQDIGDRVDYCVIRIDNTAMIEALRKRLDEVWKGEGGTFNSKIATAAIRNEGDPCPEVELPVSPRLRPQQAHAVRAALSNEVFYLWGPPGTGKTFTLSTINDRLFQGGKRVLICSNTNQAVDQVLLALCKELQPTHPAMEEGQIVRIGKIVVDELSEAFHAYVTLEGIGDRRSAALKRRKEELEREVQRIAEAAANAQRAVEDFRRLDVALDAIRQNASAIRSSEQRVADCVAEIRALERNIADFRRQLTEYEGAWAIRRPFMRQPDALEADIRKAEAKTTATTAEKAGLESDLVELRRRASDLERVKGAGQAATAGIDRVMMEAAVSQADAQAVPLNREIARINTQIADIQKSILEGAKIVGATVTRLYLSPKMFTKFDVVIVDEASMVLLPALYHAAGLAKERVIVSGDFRQLPAIVQTDEHALIEELGIDVFSTAGITEAVNTGRKPKRCVMLDVQSRMDDRICRLISGSMYEGRLETLNHEPTETKPPAPFETTLTVVDTSTIVPFVNRDPVGSRYSLMHALAVRNLIHRFRQDGYLATPRIVGVCSPFAAQARLLRRLIADLGLAGRVDAGTVHRYQGNEKEMMIIDIPDSYGEPRPGRWLDAEVPDDDGAKLFNVAISRSRDHLVIFANLEYLDKKLPAQALLRGVLSRAQAQGRTIDVRDVLAYCPIVEDLKRYGLPLDLDPETLRTGLYNQRDFDRVCMADLSAAKTSILMFSGFVTSNRVRAYEPILRSKIAKGVKVRCVTRPPHDNGSIPWDDGAAALDALEAMGCIVDTRKGAHQKIVIIDGEILWSGSLNPLSHTSQTDEAMLRMVGRELAQQIAAFVAIKPAKPAENYADVALAKENPDCGECRGRTYYVARSRNGAYWKCEDHSCGWSEGAGAKKRTSKLDPSRAPPCPKCGARTVPRAGPFGDFFGCSKHPACTGTVDGRRSHSAAKAHARRGASSRPRAATHR